METGVEGKGVENDRTWLLCLVALNILYMMKMLVFNDK